MKILLFILTQITFLQVVLAKTPAPIINCVWLPWCVDKDVANPTAADVEKNVPLDVILNITGELILYVSWIAVISLMVSWIMYVISSWDEDKVKRAKSWIIWSVTWVILSISSWWIISILNNFTLN